jgi:hypothetical protein
MKKFLLILILPILILTGCTATEPGYFLNPPGVPLEVDAGKTPPYFVGIAEGEVPEHSDFYCIGYNPTVGTVSEEIWQGSTAYVFPTVAQQMRLFSSNVADNVTGTGIRTVRIYYIDGTTRTEHTEDVTLQGTTFVNTVSTDIFRVNGLRAISSGTNNAAVGIITLEGLTGQDYRLIAIGNTRDRGAIYTVPANKTLYVTQFYVGVSGLNAANMARITLRSNFLDDAIIVMTGSLFQPYSEIVVPNGDIIPYFTIPIMFPATADIKFSAYVDSGSAFIECSIRGWIEDN